MSPPSTSSTSSPLRLPAVLVTLVIALGAVLSACGGGTSSSGSAPPPASTVPAAQLVSRSAAAANSAGVAHIVIHISQGGHSGTFVQDSARTSGRAVITIGNEQTTVLLVDNKAYIRANLAGLTTFLGFPRSLAPKLVDKWIAVRPSNSGFAEITRNLTLPQALTQLIVTAPLTKRPGAVVHGQPVYVVHGTLPGGSGDLSIASAGQPYPVHVSYAGSGASESVDLSAWGVPVDLRAPSNPIPISSTGSR